MTPPPEANARNGEVMECEKDSHAFGGYMIRLYDGDFECCQCGLVTLNERLRPYVGFDGRVFK